MSIHDTIADQIQRLRYRCGESPSMFAMTAGVRPDTILHIERKTKKVQTLKLLEIAWNLDVSILYLITPSRDVIVGDTVTPAEGVALIVKNLRRFRTQAKLSQVGLGAKAGFERQRVFTYEAGERVPTLDSLEKLAAALGVQVKDFFLPFPTGAQV